MSFVNSWPRSRKCVSLHPSPLPFSLLRNLNSRILWSLQMNPRFLKASVNRCKQKINSLSLLYFMHAQVLRSLSDFFTSFERTLDLHTRVAEKKTKTVSILTPPVHNFSEAIKISRRPHSCLIPLNISWWVQKIVQWKGSCSNENQLNRKQWQRQLYGRCRYSNWLFHKISTKSEVRIHATNNSLIHKSIKPNYFRVIFCCCSAQFCELIKFVRPMQIIDKTTNVRLGLFSENWIFVVLVLRKICIFRRLRWIFLFFSRMTAYSSPNWDLAPFRPSWFGKPITLWPFLLCHNCE